MFVSIGLFVLLLYILTMSNCFNDDWSIYERSFINDNREEIFVANATENSNFKLNFSVNKWKTLTVGRICYTGGITNDSNLVILFSTLSEDGMEKIITPKKFDLNVKLLDFEFFFKRKNGKDNVMLVVHSPTNQRFLWYSLDNYVLIKVSDWSLEKDVKHFSISKIEGKNMLFAITTNHVGKHSVDLYEISMDPLDLRFNLSIPLPYTANSLCLNTIDSNFYLSIPQTPLNQLQIYHLSQNSFTSYQNISTSKIDQVICFENGFKSFIAFNGLDAGIFEFTEEGLTRESIVNSNLEGIQFWLPIPVNTYRDETILLCQRKLDHETHFSFDVDVVTYNGNRFEEHEDIPCLLYGEQQNGLKCLTEYNHEMGILGASFIAVADYISLIVPITNSTSLLFDLEVELRKVEHPAKKQFDSYFELKDMIQTLIENQTKEYDLLLQERKRISDQHNIPDKKTSVLMASKPTKKSKILELRDKVAEVVQEIENLKTKVNNTNVFEQNEKKYRKIIFNGPVEIVGELQSERVYSSLIGGEKTEYLLNDIVRRDEMGFIGSHKTFANLIVGDINFKNVNGIPSSDFVSDKNHVVQVNGDLIFTSRVDTETIETTSNLVNDIDISKNWINFRENIKGPLEFEQQKVRNAFDTKILTVNDKDSFSSPIQEFSDEIQEESLNIPGNVTVQTINGHDFEKFLRKLCFKSLKCHMKNLIVNGVVNCRGSTKTDYLNNLKFPEEYINLESSDEVLSITALKEFTNIIRGYKISTDNKVNNIDLDKVITLSEEQKLSGNITFDNLEVASVLQVDGDINAEGIEKFAPNLGFNETMVINSNVYFSNLEVHGNIIIENNFNDQNFNKYLEDFIFRDEEIAEINGSKTFAEGFTALKNLHINSNMINNISLSSFITKDSSQELQVTTILGAVDFDHLYVHGDFDGHDIIELNSTLVRLSEDHTIRSNLTFLKHLSINNLELEELNGLNDRNTANVSSNHITGGFETRFKNLTVESLEIEGNIFGVIDQLDLSKLKEEYLSKTKDQLISKPYFVQKLILDHIKYNKINDIEPNTLFSYQKFQDNVTDFLLYRNPNIENLNVHGSLNITTINDSNFDQLAENNAWVKMYLNRSSKLLTINGNVYFKTLQLANLADTDFNEYVSSLVFKNETNVDIEDDIIFENGIIVKKIIETNILNDVALKNILRKDGEQSMLGPAVIVGNVTVEDDFKVKEMINNVDVRFIADNLDMRNNVTIVKDEIMFHRLAYIHQLVVYGTINGKYFDMEKSKFVNKNADIELDKHTLFKEMVHIYGNFGITNDVNGIILSDFLSKVVWITQDTDIQGQVKFTRPVVCHKFINIDKELITKFLFGKDLEEHVNNGVFVNKGLVKGLFNFEHIAINENLNTIFLNSLNMSNIIPLKSDQELEDLEFTEVSIYHDVDVGGKVNGVQLMEELQRTALKNIQQEILSAVVFLNNVIIEDNLKTPKINSKLTSKLVTTNTDQNLTATYNFNTKCWNDENLKVYGLVNGINLTFWKNYAVSMNLENSQKIEKQWTVVNDLNLVGPVTGGGIMNGLNITKLISEVKEKESYKCNIENGIVKDYKNLCTDLKYIYENSKKQIYKFEYFEEIQKLKLKNTIHYVKHFEDQGKHYLLINEYHSCLSQLLEFHENVFDRIRDVDTGIIHQIEVAKDNGDTFLITRGGDNYESSCKSFGSVVWRFNNRDLEEVGHFENQGLLQESQLPSTFYGLRRGLVTEFKIDKSSEIGIRQYRKWNVTGQDNVAFFPRGLKTGLALRTGENIVFLNQNDPIVEEDFGLDTEAAIIGTFTTQRNFVVPGRVGGDITVTNVGIKRNRKSLLAVAGHKEAKVQHRLDIIEIYQNPFTDELFDKIPTYRPSFLTSIEFENGETLLVFLEEQKILQVYEYKGIEGFKHRSSIRIPANQLFLMELPIGDTLKSKNVLGLINENEITLLQAVMVGNKIKDGLTCTPV